MYVYTYVFFRVLRFNSSNITLFQSHGQATNISPMFDQLFGPEDIFRPFQEFIPREEKAAQYHLGSRQQEVLLPHRSGLGVGWTRIHVWAKKPREFRQG